ncbi:golgin-45-like [Oryzias melastigma]|uniref:golgin-45-like n=1 Tax=Oryzias melastigma TaxID=30732 RepID=UPI00168D4931|nr:golgin-45-like [Oryzias melastigma]
MAIWDSLKSPRAFTLTSDAFSGLFQLAKVEQQPQTHEAQRPANKCINQLIFVAFVSLRSLEQLLVSLQWGRQQTYYPSAQPLSIGELAAANHKLADTIKSRLLGNSSSNGVKNNSAAEQLCSTPAEKMAEKMLQILDPISCSENKAECELMDSSSSNFLNSKKSIGRFHPYTRYENITFNCCERCSGDILVL